MERHQTIRAYSAGGVVFRLLEQDEKPLLLRNKLVLFDVAPSVAKCLLYTTSARSLNVRVQQMRLFYQRNSYFCWTRFVALYLASIHYTTFSSTTAQVGSPSCRETPGDHKGLGYPVSFLPGHSASPSPLQERDCL